MISYKVKLIVDKDSEPKLNNVLEAERYVFNFCSKRHFDKDAWYGSKKNSYVLLHKKCYEDIRKERPEIPSQIVLKGEQSCIAAYRSIKSNKHKITAPVEKKNLSIRLDKRLYNFLPNNKLKITTIEGRRIVLEYKPYPALQKLLDNHEQCDPLIFKRKGEFWIVLTFKINAPFAKKGNALGVDLGVKRTYATSNGEIFIDKKFNKEKRKLRFLKRQLAKCGTKSALKHKKKLSKKEHNKNINQTYLIAKELISKPETIYVLEDLTGIKQKTSKKNKEKYGQKQGTRINNKVSQVPFAKLRDVLTYKARLVGKQVETVNPFETSKRDNRTNKKDGERKSNRYYCKDGVVLDSDCNAAINIVKRSKLPFSYRNILDGQAVVNRPIVCKNPACQALQATAL